MRFFHTPSLLVGLLAVGLNSCAAITSGATGAHTTGFLSQNVGSGGHPVRVEGQPLNLSGLTRGESTETSILGLFSLGDSSMDAAAENGNLLSIHYMDRQVFSFLGIFATYTTVVLGEGTASLEGTSKPRW